ncbi:hypothetical protein SAMN04487970_1004149 [Paenibacillus tianmuensis]|uniref:Uncharacterized protein n=1 Tax=Paenibacillus tianmuensis TaxID=624147 RepID=A0A1G4PXN4_9BACL|nr:hypothetical protein [Paenibacillus tianmuensis]SCW36941.1 hypothetical protein SAMN04487970_1004149 [Paenibacillus tianmuensis]
MAVVTTVGCDIQLFCEGFLRKHKNTEKKWINIDQWYRQDDWAEYMVTENEGFHYTDLIDNRRDYGLFYLLAGVRGNDEENSYLPISKAKGLPEHMDSLVKKYYENFCEIDFESEKVDFHHASYLTLKELKDSGYGNLMELKGWVYEDEHKKATETIENGQKYQLHFVDVKTPNRVEQGMVLMEWKGYLNLNLTYLMERMEVLKKERAIENDEEIRIVFWFDN